MKASYKGGVRNLLFGVCLLPVCLTHAAELNFEPSVNVLALYNDNVRMIQENGVPESTSGYSVQPILNFSAEESRLWDLSMGTKFKITRYQDIDNADLDSGFVDLRGSRKTERSNWAFTSSFERNTNFDTDFETETQDAGLLLDDTTVRKTTTLSPSVRWNVTETSLMSFSLMTTDVSYDDSDYVSYTYDSAQLSAYWQMAQKHQLGFTSSYSAYDSEDNSFSYDQTVLQLDYSYVFSEVSSLDMSLGTRKLDSISRGVIIGFDPFAFPLVPIFGNVSGSDDGVVVNLTYTFKSQVAEHQISSGRTVIPSSFGSAQEEVSASYKFSIRASERANIKIVFDAKDTSTVEGDPSVSDRKRYRVEPAFTYKLDKNWNLSTSYRYIEQKQAVTGLDSVSNAVFINLNFNWPKLASTY